MIIVYIPFVLCSVLCLRADDIIITLVNIGRMIFAARRYIATCWLVVLGDSSSVVSASNQSTGLDRPIPARQPIAVSCHTYGIYPWPRHAAWKARVVTDHVSI